MISLARFTENLATEDSPIDVRVAKSILFGLKRQLVEWQWDKFEVWVDIPNTSIFLGNDYVASVQVDQDEIHMDYETDWKNYLLEENLQELLDKAASQLRSSRQAGSRKGKGKGKSKSKSAGKSAGQDAPS